MAHVLVEIPAHVSNQKKVLLWDAITNIVSVLHVDAAKDVFVMFQALRTSNCGMLKTH
jgi:hypothetical protein